MEPMTHADLAYNKWVRVVPQRSTPAGTFIVGWVGRICGVDPDDPYPYKVEFALEFTGHMNRYTYLCFSAAELELVENEGE